MTNGDIIPGAMHVPTVFISIRECKGDLRPAKKDHLEASDVR